MVNNGIIQLEVIELRSTRADLEEVAGVLEELVRDAAAATSKTEIVLYRSRTLEGDFAVHLTSTTTVDGEDGTPLGERMTDLLRSFGLVNYTVWYRTEAE